MQIAVLPLNAGPGSRPALARQLSSFACEVSRTITGQEIHAVNYMAQFPDEGVTRYAMVNPSEALNESEVVGQFFQQADMELLVDGLFAETENGSGTVTLRVFKRGEAEPIVNEEHAFLPGGIFGPARGFVQLLVSQLGKAFPEELNDDEKLFGTTDPEAFVNFMAGFDAAQYIEKAQGMVAREFDPSLGFDALSAAVEKDPEWEAPYMTTLNLARLCTQFRIGDAQKIEGSLKNLIEKDSEDWRAWFALGEFYGAVGNSQGSADNMEKAVVKLQMRVAKLNKEAEGAEAIGDKAGAQAIRKEAAALSRDEAPVLARLGMAQIGMGMPANAERNFRRAVELEGDDKPTLQLLAQVLTQTGRAHEVPPLVKEVLEKNPDQPQIHVNYAMSLMAAGKNEEAAKAFDHALSSLEDTTLVKRYYAPILAQDGNLDRAMDFYEDVIEVVPNDVPVLLEYAQTLQNANRAFEVPKILKDVLNTDPDQNTRAQTQAWLIRLEQPKRVEAVDSAAQKLQQGDAEGALKELKPLKNWLGDFFEFWLHLADAYNRVGEHKEAENAAQQLIGMFPGFEPAYAMLAAALHGQDRDEDAYNFLRMAMANNSNSLTIALNLAQACMWTGRADEGRTLTRQIREATNNDENIAQILDSIEGQVV